MFKSNKLTFSQDGGVGRHSVPPHTTKRRTTTNLKTKNNQKLPENQTVWKSNNQGVKEETFIQTGRRRGNRQPVQTGCAARWWTCQARRQLEDQAVPHSCVDKPGETTGKQDRPCNLGFQCRKPKPQNLWL